MTKITFYDGVNEIGGNKIFIEDVEKEFLDFGKSHSREGIVAYSGDIRIYGANKGIAEDLIEKANERIQSIAITIFAPFAFFAVRCLCYSNGSPDTNTKGN
ncbi:MAG: hypothetical protein WCE94_01595 [Candidatus Methanoperedens sp.]